MKKIVCLVLIFLLSGVLFSCTQYHAQGAGAGAAIGGIAGALLDRKNPWRGGVIGAALGGVAGATIVDISMKAKYEAAASQKPVEYRTTDGTQITRADPVDYSEQTKCSKVRTRVWENNELVKDQVQEVCDADLKKQGYM
jgi:outer membrane lipoprotein SlyB